MIKGACAASTEPFASYICTKYTLCRFLYMRWNNVGNLAIFTYKILFVTHMSYREEHIFVQIYREWSGGVMVLGKLPVRGV